jgi:catechol-2,3-dioxygenase
MNTVTRTRSVQDDGLAIERLGYLTVATADLTQARDFYGRVLGLEERGTDRLPGFGAHAIFRLPSRQLLVLTEREGPDTRDTGVHHGFRVSAAARTAIAERLAANDIKVETYNEDRPKEAADNFYFHDRDGNRLQLVAAETARAQDRIDAIDHTVVLVYHILWAESYYGNDLKLPIESRVGVRTAEHARARRWAAGQEAMAPGTRRLDKLYMPMGGQNEVARANMQVYFAAGNSIFGIYLATKHQQEPPEEQIVGTPRTAFVTTRHDLDRIAAILQKRERPFQGPVEHPSSVPFAASLYGKDPSGNFLEFIAPRR